MDAHTAYVQQLFVQNIVGMRGYILALLPDFSRVDDIVQETFVTVTAKAGSFQAGTNFRAWVFAIARNKVLEALRDSAHSGAALSLEVVESLSVVEDVDFWSEQRLRTLADCVSRLAPQARRAIELRYQDAHRPPEIAQIMGWTVNAVNVALARSRNALRSCVEGVLGRKTA